MPASDAIPPIALPFVSDKAKKTLDLVTHTHTPTHLSPITCPEQPPSPPSLESLTIIAGRELRRARMHTRRHGLPRPTRRRRAAMERPPIHHRRPEAAGAEAGTLEYVFA